MSGTRVAIHVPKEDASPEAGAPAVEARLLLTSDAGRDAFLTAARKRVPMGWCLAETKDLASHRRSFQTRPLDPRAQLVAETLPKTLRGSLVSRVRYHLVPEGALVARETHHEEGRVSHEYDVKLRVLVRGTATPTLTPIPA